MAKDYMPSMANIRGGRTFKLSLRERFHMCYMPVTESGCWLWIGKADGKGYGRINNGRGKSMALAPRVAWELLRGPIPPGMCVCHKCDVPACVNPAHLFLGSLSDNMQDMIRKGRSAFQKLTVADAKAIKYGTGEIKALASKYGVSLTLLYNIRKGVSWKSI